MATQTTKLGIKNPVYTTNLQTGDSSFKQEGYVPQQETPQQTVQPTETVPTPNFKDQKTTTIQPTPVPFTDIQKIEQDKQAQARQPIKQKETPVTLKSGQEVMLNAQEVKMREQNLKNQELQTKTAEKQAKMTDLSNFLANTPDKTSINRYLKINYAPEYRAEYQNTLKAYFKQSDINQKVQKYSTTTPDVIDDAVKTGELIPGTEAYNALPPEKRQEYEEYATVKQRSQLLDTYVAPKTDFTSILESIKGVFSTNYKKDFQDRLNSSEVKQYTKDLENLDIEIQKIDTDIGNIAKDRAGVAKGVPSSLQRAENAKDIEALLDEKNTLINQYTAKKATLDSIKDDINTELEIARIDDENAKSAYMTTLSIYQTEQARMDAVDKANFEAESKLRAEERQRDFQKEMLQIQQDFESKNQKGTYQTDREGNLLYVTNGVAEKVKQADGTVVGMTKEKTFTDTIQKNDDGSFSILRTYENGTKPDLFTYGVSGENSQNTNLSVWNNISNISDKVGKYSGEVGKFECGEGVNYYLKDLGVDNIDMGNSYESKKDDINSQSPQIGGLAVWNATPEGKYGENGHVGIVTGYNQQTGEVEITDWNSKGDREKRTYNITVSQINNSDGGFVHLSQTTQTTQNFDEAKVPQYIDYIEDGKIPTGLKPGTPRYQQFINEAQQGYTFSKNQTLQTKGFIIDDVGAFSGTSKKQKEDISTAINNVLPFIQSMDKAIELVKIEGTALPFTEVGKKINQEIRNAQLLAKEIYNLGVLNGPDLALMESIIANPTSASSLLTSYQDYAKILENGKKTILDNAIAKAGSVGLKFSLQDTTQKAPETPIAPVIKPQTGSLDQEFNNYVSDTDLQGIFNK